MVSMTLVIGGSRPHRRCSNDGLRDERIRNRTVFAKKNRDGVVATEYDRAAVRASQEPRDRRRAALPFSSGL